MKLPVAALFAGLLLIAPHAAFGETPQNPIFRTSILITPTIKRSDPVWSWAPRIKFNVQGPLPSGGQIAVEFFQPGGRPWVKYDCKIVSLAHWLWLHQSAFGRRLATTLSPPGEGRNVQTSA